MSNSTQSKGVVDPPLIAWFVVEVDVEFERDNPLFVSMRGPFADEEKAERERDAQQDAWEQALEEWDGENPYDFKGWQIVRKHIFEGRIDALKQEDEESHQIAMAAADAIMEPLLADEGIETMRGEQNE